MSEPTTGVWVLCDCPPSLEEWQEIVSAAVALRVGLLLRPGLGLDPFFLMNRSSSRGLVFGLWMHLRDKTLPALESDLRTALAMGVETIMIGDPLPLPAGTKAVQAAGPIHAPRFVASVRALAGRSTRIGTVNQATDPADLRFLGAMLAAGCAFAALPDGAWARFAAHPPLALDVARVQPWCWCRPGDRAPDRGLPLLLELDLTNDSFAEALPKRLSELGQAVGAPGTGRTGKGKHAPALNP